MAGLLITIRYRHRLEGSRRFPTGPTWREGPKTNPPPPPHVVSRSISATVQDCRARSGAMAGSRAKGCGDQGDAAEQHASRLGQRGEGHVGRLAERTAGGEDVEERAGR